MATLDLQVHKYEKVPGTQTTRLAKVTPYLRITRDGHPPLYLQGGKAFGEGGAEIETLPIWFDEELAKVSPKAREEIGWSAPAAATEVAALWTCGECGEEVIPSRKGVHVMQHRRKGG